MSLERSVERIAESCELMSRYAGNGHGAIADVLKQRDQAQKDLQQTKDSLHFWRNRHTEAQQSVERMARRIAALQGVITRMKRKR